MPVKCDHPIVKQVPIRAKLYCICQKCGVVQNDLTCHGNAHNS